MEWSPALRVVDLPVQEPSLSRDLVPGLVLRLHLLSPANYANCAQPAVKLRQQPFATVMRTLRDIGFARSKPKRAGWLLRFCNYVANWPHKSKYDHLSPGCNLVSTKNFSFLRI